MRIHSNVLLVICCSASHSTIIWGAPVADEAAQEAVVGVLHPHASVAQSS